MATKPIQFKDLEMPQEVPALLRNAHLLFKGLSEKLQTTNPVRADAWMQLSMLMQRTADEAEACLE